MIQKVRESGLFAFKVLLLRIYPVFPPNQLHSEKFC